MILTLADLLRPHREAVSTHVLSRDDLGDLTRFHDRKAVDGQDGLEGLIGLTGCQFLRGEHGDLAPYIVVDDEVPACQFADDPDEQPDIDIVKIERDFLDVFLRQGGLRRQKDEKKQAQQ